MTHETNSDINQQSKLFYEVSVFYQYISYKTLFNFEIVHDIQMLGSFITGSYCLLTILTSRESN